MWLGWGWAAGKFEICRADKQPENSGQKLVLQSWV